MEQTFYGEEVLIMTKLELVEALNLFPDDARVCVTNLGQLQLRDIITVLCSEDEEAVIEINCEEFSS